MTSQHWSFLDHQFWGTLVEIITLVVVYNISVAQTKISDATFRTQDSVELYASSMLEVTEDDQGKPIRINPKIHIQNIGTRLIYLDSYTFNGRVYELHGRVLPSTYSQAINNSYWIELPTNGESHVSLEIRFHDVELRKWASTIVGKSDGNSWRVDTYPRKSLE